MSLQEKHIIDIARAIRDHAYAPYSKFRVGAALVSSSEKIYQGCNVENLSFGLTMCAERIAVGAAVADGARDFRLLAIVADSNDPIVPCGACRQVLAEFNPTLRIISSTLGGRTAEFHLEELLPKPSQGILESST